MTTLRFDNRDIEVGEPFKRGDFCTLQHGTLVIPAKKTDGGDFFDQLLGGSDEECLPCLIKVSLSPHDASFMAAERDALSRIESPNQKYFPTLYAHAHTKDVATHILSYNPNTQTHEDMLAAHPKGLSFRQVAKVFQQVLVGLGHAHRLGLVHGAILPSHIVVSTDTGGVQIVDWCYSVRYMEKTSIRAYVKAYREFYPPEVFAKRFPTPATDIYMAAKVGVALLGGNAWKGEATSFRDLFGMCLSETMRDRYQSAFTLLAEFDRLCLNQWGTDWQDPR